MVISTYNPLELPYKLQNLASLCSVRFAQHRHESPDPTRHSRFWQTVVPDARTVSFAWDDPVNEGLAINSSLAAVSGPNSKPKPAAGPSLSDDPVGALGNLGYQVYDAIAQPLGLGAPPERPKVKRVRQYPFLVTLQVFTHKEVFEIDFDISLARVGSRMRLKLPGGRPDVVVQTRIESTTGAVVSLCWVFVVGCPAFVCVPYVCCVSPPPCRCWWCRTTCPANVPSVNCTPTRPKRRSSSIL